MTRRALLVLLALAQLMVILDISAVNVALPNLARDLKLSRTELSWTLTSYSVVYGSLLLLGGRASDLLGRRRMFLTGLAVFTAASLGSSLAGAAAALFAARALQGLGAAMLSPAALSIITATFSGPDRTRALGVWGAIGGAGAAVGVLLGGVLTQLIDWRAIFFINLPVGLLVGVGALHNVPADPARAQWRRLDLRGAIVAALSFGSLVYAFSQAASAGWLSAKTLGFVAAGLAGLALFAALERTGAWPLLRIQRLRDRAIGGGFVMMLAGSGVMFGSFLLSSLYLQNVLGTGALDTGLAFLPLATAAAAGVHLATHVVSRRGVRGPLAAGLAAAAGGMLLLTGVSPDGSYFTDLLPGMVIVGVGLGMLMVTVAMSILAGARDEEAGMLSGLNTTGHEVGGALGLAILTTIATGSLSAAPGRAAAVALSNGIGDGFLAGGIIAGVASIAALLILPRAKSFLPRLALTPRVSIH